MVWIYGGGFQNGSASDPEFDGAAINRRGVILVTFNYRGGPMGFFSSSRLEEQFGCASNIGILDQIAALHWVRENISAFGGDPDNITIFGQSAGGISARIHLVNELSAGLFQKAVIQSGGGFNEADLMRTKEEYQNLCGELQKRLNLTDEDMMTKDGVELCNELSTGASEMLKGEVGFFQPFLDGKILKQAPGKSIRAQKYADIPVICGTVSGDSWMFSRKVVPELLKAGNTAYYRGFALSPHQAWGQMQTEWERESPYFAYYFDRRQPPWKEGRGQKMHFGQDTPHGSEIAYVFGTLESRNGYGEEEYRISEMLTDYWTNFAKNGNPNGPSVPAWPAFTKENQVSLHISDSGVCAENVVQTQDEQKVLDFIKQNPGMTVSLKGFEL